MTTRAPSRRADRAKSEADRRPIPTPEEAGGEGDGNANGNSNGGGGGDDGPVGFVPGDEDGDIAPISIEDEMKTSYLDYAMSVIVARALPDVRDGLKPVHRRILFSMNENGYDWNKPLSQIGPRGRRRHRQISPAWRPIDLRRHGAHGAGFLHAAAAARRARQFRLGRRRPAGRHALHRSADGQAGDALLQDIDEATVDFQDNYDNTEREPVVLPARFPNLLVNGANGIAVGMATNVPPHNLGELVDAAQALIDNPELPDEELLQHRARSGFPDRRHDFGL